MKLYIGTTQKNNEIDVTLWKKNRHFFRTMSARHRLSSGRTIKKFRWSGFVTIFSIKNLEAHLMTTMTGKIKSRYLVYMRPMINFFNYFHFFFKWIKELKLNFSQMKNLLRNAWCCISLKIDIQVIIFSSIYTLVVIIFINF